MKKYEAIIFDMDGVLFDTERVWFEIYSATCAEYGYDLSLENYTNTIGFGEEPSRIYFKSLFGNDFPIGEIEKISFERRHLLFEEKGMPMKEGVVEIFEFIKSINIPCAVATSTITTVAKAHLDRGGITQYLSALVGGDQIEHGKPAPDIYLKAANLISVDPKNCIAFEDSDPGVRAAASAGMTVFCIPDIKQPSEVSMELAFQICASMSLSLNILKEIFS